MSPASPLSRSITKMQGEKGMRGEGAGVDARLRYPAISELTPCSPTPLFHAPPHSLVSISSPPGCYAEGETTFFTVTYKTVCYVRVGGALQGGGGG